MSVVLFQFSSRDEGANFYFPPPWLEHTTGGWAAVLYTFCLYFNLRFLNVYARNFYENFYNIEQDCKINRLFGVTSHPI